MTYPYPQQQSSAKPVSFKQNYHYYGQKQIETFKESINNEDQALQSQDSKIQFTSSNLNLKQMKNLKQRIENTYQKSIKIGQNEQNQDDLKIDNEQNNNKVEVIQWHQTDQKIVNKNIKTSNKVNSQQSKIDMQNNDVDIQQKLSELQKIKLHHMQTTKNLWLNTQTQNTQQFLDQERINIDEIGMQNDIKQGEQSQDIILSNNDVEQHNIEHISQDSSVAQHIPSADLTESNQSVSNQQSINAESQKFTLSPTNKIVKKQIKNLTKTVCNSHGHQTAQFRNSKQYNKSIQSPQYSQENAHKISELFNRLNVNNRPFIVAGDQRQQNIKMTISNNKNVENDIKNQEKLQFTLANLIVSHKSKEIDKQLNQSQIRSKDSSLSISKSLQTNNSQQTTPKLFEEIKVNQMMIKQSSNVIQSQQKNDILQSVQNNNLNDSVVAQQITQQITAPSQNLNNPLQQKQIINVQQATHNLKTEQNLATQNINQETVQISHQQYSIESKQGMTSSQAVITKSETVVKQTPQVVCNPVPFIPVFEQYTNVAQQQYTLKIVFYFEIQPKFYIFNLLKNEDFVLSETLISVTQNKNEYTLQFKFENSDVGTYPHLLIYSPQNIFQVVLTYSPVQPTAKFQKDYDTVTQHKTELMVGLINPITEKFQQATITQNEFSNFIVVDQEGQDIVFLNKNESDVILSNICYENLPQCALSVATLKKQHILQQMKNSISSDPEKLNYFTEKFQQRLELQDDQKSLVYDRGSSLVVVQNLQPYILNFQKTEQTTLIYLAFLHATEALYNLPEENSAYKNYIQKSRQIIEYNDQSKWNSKSNVLTNTQLVTIVYHKDIQVEISESSCAIIVGKKDNQVVDFIELHQTKQIGLSFFDADLELWVMDRSSSNNTKQQRMQIPNIIAIQKKVEKQKSKKTTYKVERIDPLYNLIEDEIQIAKEEIVIKKQKVSQKIGEITMKINGQTFMIVGKQWIGQFKASDDVMLEILVTINMMQEGNKK